MVAERRIHLDRQPVGCEINWTGYRSLMTLSDRKPDTHYYLYLYIIIYDR